ncbi:MFS transporter [Pseudonocardia sp. CA-107938]|uniref:MFS transporter n=1 Tax=Pseudonocardia sp. CA-107938 TaxID=3240021 RepID=UPI003D8C7511
MTTSLARPATTGSTRHGAGFWIVALGFLSVMGLSAAASPLYPAYQQLLHFSTFTVTLVFAAYAVGVVASLLTAGHLSDVHGRRRVLVPAVALSVASAVAYLLWPTLLGLYVARLLNGFSVGMVTATATAWLTELHAAHRPAASPARAQVVAAIANLGGIGLGPLVGGLIAEHAPEPLVTPYVVFLVPLVVSTVALLLAPETRPATVPRPRYRIQRVAVPPQGRVQYAAAAAAAFLGLGVLGLFTALTATFLAGPLHTPGPARTGEVIFVVFAAGTVTQLVASRFPPRRRLAAGMPAIVAGLAVLTVSVWLPTPSLLLFVAGALVSGVGAGLLFSGGLGLVAQVAPRESLAEAQAGLFLAGYLGLIVPVVGVGVALLVLSPQLTLTLFATLVAAGTATTAFLLRGR